MNLYLTNMKKKVRSPRLVILTFFLAIANLYLS